jgi:threonine dehydratase
VVPVGGGGLIAGITVALRGRGSDAAVVGVQAKDADALALSMEYGTRVKLKEPRTVADGIRVGVPGARTLPILRQHGIRVIRVEEEGIQRAITALCHTAKLVVEPAGAAGAAAILAGAEEIASHRRIACILSGANVDIPPFVETLRSHPYVE